MAYNKAKEEKKWRIWKEAEEKKMRQLGVSEDVIQQLRINDWAVFNSERRYYEKLQDTGTYLDTIAESTSQTEIKSVEDFLNSVEDERLYQELLAVDKLTLQAVVLKIQGYSTREIASLLDLTEKSIYRRMDRLKEKLKTFNS